jgi:tetratricopeptide (TPR) repeat protein
MGLKDEAEVFSTLRSLASLWRAEEIAASGAAELSRHIELLRRMRAVFARAGGDREVVLLLAMLSVADPWSQSVYDAEMAEIFNYADELAVAEYGDGAERSRSVEILEETVRAFPSPQIIETFTGLVVARQQALDARFRRQGADLQTIRAHGRGVLRAAWDVAGAHIRQRRYDRALLAAASVRGIGDHPELVGLLRAIFKKNATVGDYVRLANVFRSSDNDATNTDAALAVCQTAIVKFPKAAEGYACAGHAAFESGNTRLAITRFEKALRIEPNLDLAAERLSQLYQLTVSELAQGDRVREAQDWVARVEKFHRARHKRGQKALTPGVAEAYAALARGLVGLGDIDSAHVYLEQSIDLRATRAALELSGTIALKRGDYSRAISQLSQAVDLRVERIEQYFDRNRILRLLGEAHLGAGDDDQARECFRNAMAAWTELINRVPLAQNGLAEVEVERGKLYWSLQQRGQALQAFERAVDADPNGAGTHTEAVAFLVSHGEYDQALDTYHRALGSRVIRDYYKVYMSLWMLAEARRQGVSPDPLAFDFLTTRDGKLWYDELARFAIGRGEVAPLRARADTRGRQAELFFYSAAFARPESQTVGEVRSLLKQVIDTNTVLFFEYEMAKRRLDASAANQEARR